MTRVGEERRPLDSGKRKGQMEDGDDDDLSGFVKLYFIFQSSMRLRFGTRYYTIIIG